MPSELAGLRTADADAATRFFADVDPEELVRVVAETSDADLLELISRDEIRPAAIEGSSLVCTSSPSPTGSRGWMAWCGSTSSATSTSTSSVVAGSWNGTPCPSPTER